MQSGLGFLALLGRALHKNFSVLIDAMRIEPHQARRRARVDTLIFAGQQIDNSGAPPPALPRIFILGIMYRRAIELFRTACW